MKLITAEIAAKLAANTSHAESWDGDPSDRNKPVLKLFNPCGDGTWLISEMHDDDMLFGLCDLGHGSPELGYISLSEVQSVRLPFGLKIERDRGFKPKKTLNEYAQDARDAGYIKT